MHIVVDTNVLVSYFLRTESVPGQAVRKALRMARLAISEATLAELIAVLEREKFSRYTTPELIRDFVRSIVDNADCVNILRPIKACRDPGDDKFLDVAIATNARYLVTGDDDLLVLHPFMETHIITPAAFLCL